MAWRAGVEFTVMERSMRSSSDSAYSFPSFGTGNAIHTWYPCNMVDANGKEIPWVDRDGTVLKTVSERSRPSPGQEYFLMVAGSGPGKYKYRGPGLIPDLQERIEKGEYSLPLYADLPGMPEHERRVIWGLMIGEEGRTKVPILKTYTEAGFDPDKDLLQSYYMLRGDPMWRVALPQERVIFGGGGGVVVDWDLKTNLEGLYAAGEQSFDSHGHTGAATSGRWAGRKAAGYALKAGKALIDRKQVEDEKTRIYAPLEQVDVIDWKELNAGLCRIMQNYCGEPKNDELLKIGLTALKEIEEDEVPRLYADNPHKLMRSLEVLDILTCDRIIMHACMERKASSSFLNFIRTDYPEMDPPEWRKWITIRLEDGKVKSGEMPMDFSEPLKENFEAHLRE